MALAQEKADKVGEESGAGGVNPLPYSKSNGVRARSRTARGWGERLGYFTFT